MDDYERLKSMLAELGGAVIGYSGGVDSTLVAKAATDALGERAVCVIIESVLNSAWEIEDAVRTADKLGLRLVRVQFDPLEDERVARNDAERCYHCKKGDFGELLRIARERNIACVLDGTNADDASDYRPGLRATAELGIRSPLKELGITKAQVRSISRELGLPTWDRPAHACLASRVPYGTRLQPDVLRRIGQAESVLRELGFRQARLRHHDDIARVEVEPDELQRLAAPEVRERVVKYLKRLGYTYVTADLSGYRTGSLNEVLGVES